MKKGFTLTELLMVIVLLGLLGLIVIPVVDKLIKDSKEDLYKTQINNIELAAKNWATSNIFQLPDSGYVDRTICDLERTGFLEIDVKNPKTEELFYKDSYVRITKTDYGYDYDYIEGSGGSYSCYICEAVTEETRTEGNIPNGNYNLGDEYLCEVKPGTEYHFFVVSTEDENVNLIMDSNINSDGQAVNQVLSNKGLVAWINQEDCEATGCYGLDNGWVTTNKGPVTALRYLNEATKDWSLISNLNETYETYLNVENGQLSINLNGKARMLRATDIGINLDTYPVAEEYPWLITNLDTPKHERLNGVYGYWTLDPYYLHDVWSVEYNGHDTDEPEELLINGIYTKKPVDGPSIDYYCGVRPVISVKKEECSN